MTARWAVDEVQANRDVEIEWQPISLLVKNQPDPDSDYYAPAEFSHKLMRVMESARKEHGNQAVKDLYWEFGSRIHHDRDIDFDVGDAVEAAGYDRGFGESFDDESIDAEIQTRMDVGMALVGTDVGTPIISLPGGGGETVGLFGPVITRVPDTESSLKLWDGFVTMANVDGFWELKRTRTEPPDFGERP